VWKAGIGMEWRYMVGAIYGIPQMTGYIDRIKFKNRKKES
jgi:hypothetical protein